ncbi:hypothetical protein MesoLj131a_60590 [Mesorhizobium sp. 131-2-1]|nr:hypothetical protein MesoLj131a_60590 [Mesorhizobium sp. 131-2-1]BCH04267.1 hypothetical protein MesoLj131b_62660 [Mesorhizobium sp. 131-2-5]
MRKSLGNALIGMVVIGVAVGLGPSSLPANGELKSTTGNTVTATYAPHDFHKPFPRRPHASAAGDPNGANTLELDPGVK